MSAQRIFSVTAREEGAVALDDELLALIYGGPLETRPWAGLLKALRARLQCWHVNIAFHRSTRPGAWFDSVVDSEDSIYVSPIDYCGKYAAMDPIPYQELTPGRPYLKKEIYTTVDVFYRDFLQPQGIDDFMIVLIEEGSGMRAWLTLARKSIQPPFSALDCSFIASLTSHFTTALRTFATLKAAELERDVYRSALDSFACGTLLIDQCGRVTRVDRLPLDYSHAPRRCRSSTPACARRAAAMMRSCVTRSVPPSATAAPRTRPIRAHCGYPRVQMSRYSSAALRPARAAQIRKHRRRSST